ncbi:MAG: glucosamine-6-phosphate deaminase [Planctomycetes bacterium]|nr:glucosamine-6-phosphate deaminase [Planctomycetota bacterium]
MKEPDFIISPVEQVALKASDFKAIYRPTEKIPTIVVENFPALGKLTAMRFIEWVQNNPGGVISLPTGKTPEHFIKWVNYLLGGWESLEIRSELETAGIDPARKPDIAGLHFVQIDDFYPIESFQTNSFNHYVKKYYIDGFGLDEKKALLIDPSRIGLADGENINDIWPDKSVDLTLRCRRPKTVLEQKQKTVLSRVDQWCMEYEDKIKKIGGIGFFLGGIGPDGHIGFNIKGSDHHFTTRLCPTNYETQAAAATDLGGIEIARKSLVITIGLRTISRNPDCTVIIMAAGQAKAPIVAQAIESEPTIETPASVLGSLPNARFYLTRGAVSGLSEHSLDSIRKEPTLSDDEAEKIVVDLAVKNNKSLLEIKEEDIHNDRFASVAMEKVSQPIQELLEGTRSHILKKIEHGLETLTNKSFLHTEPHHDDIMLGYFAHVVRHLRSASNTHHFMALTSGFTSVSNEFMLKQIAALKKFITLPEFVALYNENYFRCDDMMARNRDVWQYLDGVAANSEYLKDEGCARRFIRNVTEVFASDSYEKFVGEITGLEKYFQSQYPGAVDSANIQRLKGMCREWEAECLWGYYGWQCDNISHLRLGFYTGDIFTQEPTHQRDVMPIVQKMEETNPDIVTVALDPEASGPDTHYKVLQAVAEALHIYQEKTGKKDVKIWGYRNVWYRFDPSEVNIFVPVSLNMFSIMHQSFEDAFISQRNASFPSHEYDGPFSELAQQIQVQQYQKLKTCLGREWFYNHSSPLIRATRGFLFIKEMSPEEFYASCRKLRKSVEAV